MKKIIYTLIIIIALYLFLIPTRITPEGYYHVSKESRLKIINNLKQNCTSDNPIYLISTYLDVFKDKNTSSCWGKYMNECKERNIKHLNLKIPIECSIY